MLSSVDLPTPSGTDQPDHAARRQRDGDRIERQHATIALRDIVQTSDRLDRSIHLRRPLAGVCRQNISDRWFGNLTGIPQMNPQLA